MQARDVTFSVADPDQDIVGGFPDGPVTPPSLTWVAPSPASGATGAASGNFVATLLNGVASVTVTPSSDKAGTWTPASRTLTVGTPTGSFTFTPSAGGAHVASLANDAGIAAPATVSYTAAAAPAAGFTAAPTSGTVPFSVTVTSSATGTGLTYDYDWGDGSSHSTSANPSHAYTVAGSYTLTQTVTDAYGRTASTTRAITASAAGAGLTVGAQITTLAVTSESGSGARPFVATVLPLRGVVPAGERLTDATGAFDSTVLSAHDDGSAAVVVLSGTASATGSLAVHRATGSTTALTAAAIAAAGLTSVSVAFGSPYGTATISDFSTPERTWWANSKTICARYRVAAPTPGSTALEAVIDVHAWAGRALVEVTVENAKVDCTLSTVTKPAAANYTGATVSVNGSTVATVNSADVPTEAAHSWSRAFYARAWVGGDPGLRVHQAVADLQQHPLLFVMDQACTADLSGYAADAYAPWANGRIPASNMGGVGDVDAIGPLTKWDAQWLQSGDSRAASAVEQNALCALSFNVNSRSQATGRVPTFTEIDLKSFNGNHTWPQQTNGSAALEWELMHHPAVGLAAFLVRPSPVFIELAQKVAVWNAMYVTNFDRSTVQPTGVFRGGACSSRGRAWGLRSLAHAIYLTPDGDAWKAPAKTNLAANVTYLDGYRTAAAAKLGVTWEGDPDLPTTTDYNTAAFGAGFAIRQWMYQYLLVEVHKIASARLLTGSDQTAITTLADWMCSYPVRWINEQPNGGWRYLPYSTVIGDNSTTINSPTTWLDIRARTHSDIPAALTGTWYFATGEPVSYSAGYGNGDTNRPRYVDYFWSALVAAVERGVAGSRAAWTKVQREVTNLSAWRAGFGLEPRWGSAPRSVAESYGVVDSATSALASGAWADISSSTNVAAVTDTGPEGAATIPWLSGSGESAGYRPLMSWGGNLTFDPTTAEIVAVGATNGYSSDSPAGNHTAELRLPLKTGVFAKTWSPFASNTAHQYDANSTTDSPLGRLRRSYDNAGLYRKSAGSWSYVDHTGSGKMGINTSQSPSGEYHPRLGRQGSFLVAGNGGILGRLDEHTATQSQISASNSGVGGPEVICAYHPAIDKVIFGGGTGGTTLYGVDSAGTVASFLSSFPAGVTEIGPRDVINAVLAPDPQGRAYAWLFDRNVTGKVWRLNLSTLAWTDMGAMPGGVGGVFCVGTVPPLGIHLLLCSGVNVTAGVNDGKVWAYRPA